MWHPYHICQSSSMAPMIEYTILHLGQFVTKTALLSLWSTSRDEPQHTFPGIGRCISKFYRLAVKETMWSSWIEDNFMLDSSFAQPLIKLMYLLRRDSLVSLTKEAKYWIFDIFCPLKDTALATR